MQDTSASGMQIELLPMENVKTKPSGSNGSGFLDPAFASNKQVPIHRWIPWIAGFSSDFVNGALTNYTNRKGVVLDAFSGVGTTLVEAVLSGHKAIGFEINPYAALASSVKTSAHKIDVDEFEKSISEFQAFYADRSSSSYIPASKPPEGFRTKAEFYSPKVLKKVLIIQDYLSRILTRRVSDLFRLAFAGTMVTYSNYSYEPSLGQRVSSGKSIIHDFPVHQTVLAKLHEMLHDIRWLQQRTVCGKARVINRSFFECRQHLDNGSVDIIITSPPYLNNYHYNRNTRPQVYWLGYAQGVRDMNYLEALNFGKYWQTVREIEKVELDFTLPASDIHERLAALRERTPEKGIYGGNGWANYAATYFNDCRRFALGIRYCLKRNGTALVVIGNSILQGILIPTDQYFGMIAESVGLELVGIDIPRATRIGNSIIQSKVRTVKAHDSHQLYEAVVVLKKK